MSEHKEFDDYIKGLFDKDPAVPSELNWEAMDFDLPKTEVVPKKKPPKRKYKKYILLLLLFFTTFIGFLGINKYKSNTVQQPVLSSAALQSSELDVPELQASELDVPELNSVASKSTTNYNGKDQSIESLASETNESQTRITDDKPMAVGELNTDSRGNNSEPSTIKTSTINAERKTIERKAVEEEFIEDAKPLLTETLNQEITEQLPVQSTFYNTDNAIIEKDTKDQLEDNFTTAEVVNKTPIQPSQDRYKEDKKTNDVSLLESISISSLINKEDLTLLVPETLAKKENPKAQSKAVELFVGYGYNTFDINIAESNILQGKLNKDFGKSFSSGIRLDINDSWKTSLQINYDQYHSTFEHIRDLEPVIDFTKFQRVHRQERTFHNNYTNTIGLQLGLERKISLSKSLYLYSGIGIAPTYVLSSKGKTTDGNLIETLTYDNQLNKLSVSGGLNFRLAYAINPALNLEMHYQYNQFLLNGIFINNGVSAKQQNTLSLQLSYQLK